MGIRAGERASGDAAAELREAHRHGANQISVDGGARRSRDVKQVWSNFDIEEKEIEASLA